MRRVVLAEDNIIKPQSVPTPALADGQRQRTTAHSHDTSTHSIYLYYQNRPLSYSTSRSLSSAEVGEETQSKQVVTQFSNTFNYDDGRVHFPEVAADRLQAIVGGLRARLRIRNDALKDLPRVELFFKSKVELVDRVRLLKESGFADFSLLNIKDENAIVHSANRSADSKMLEWLQVCLDEVPDCSLCVHYALRHNVDAGGAADTFARFTRFLSKLNTLNKSESQRVEVLLISGPGPKAGPKTPLDSVACLERLMHAGSSDQWADLGVAFNPHYQDAAQVKAERARLRRKLATRRVRTVFLQFGCDAQRLEESLQWLTSEVNCCLQVERLMDDFRKTAGRDASSDVQAVKKLRDEVERARQHLRAVPPPGLKWECLDAPTAGREIKNKALQQLLREKSEITREELSKMKDLRGLTYDDCITVDGSYFKPVPIQKDSIKINNFFDGQPLLERMKPERHCPWIPFKPAFQRKAEARAAETGQKSSTATDTSVRVARDPRRLRVIGSLLLPTKQLLIQKSSRSWEGTFLSEAYLSCTEQAEAISKEILAIYARYGVELLVEAPGVQSLEDIALLRSLTAEYYKTTFDDKDEEQEDERLEGRTRKEHKFSHLYRTL